jgi:TPR repeat protein
VMYWQGYGVRQNDKTAESWLTKAAAKGDEPARNDLKEMRRKSVQPVKTGLGLTVGQIETSLGPPETIFDGGTTQLYIYPKLKLKITFKDGKVVAMQ